jgi:signal transduction histidine kinase
MRLLIVTLATVAQIATIVFAVRMSLSSAGRRAWALLASAFCLMLVGRVAAIEAVFQHRHGELDSLPRVGLSLAVSTLLLGSMYYIRRAFIERERAQASVALGRQRLDMMLKAAPIGLWYSNIPLDRLVWDARVREHFWLAGEGDVTLAMFYQSLHAEDRDRIRQAVERSISDRVAFDVEYRTVSPLDSSQIKWIRAFGSVSSEDGVPVRFDGITLDITDQKRGEIEYAQLLASERLARRDAEVANRLKDDFLSTVSHELRTPLSAILGWAQLLRSGKVGIDDTGEGIAVIERNARAQKQIIEDLLDMSRIISGKLRMNVQRIDMAPVIGAAIDTVRTAADAKNITLSKSIDAGATIVNGDPNRLQQVVWNLLANAIKFTPKGGRVDVALSCVNSQVQIAVSDSGAGITPEFLPHLFERFRQGDSSASRLHGGLGLGLSIVRQLVELHGGTVTAYSEGPGRGARLVVAIPLSPVTPEVADESNQISGAARGGAGISLKGVRVMVVDDEADARDLVRLVLEKFDAQVVTAGSAAEALTEMEKQTADVLLSDIGMPGFDGYQFIRAVRERGNAVPAAALTAFARSEDRRRAMLAGYQLHVAKPVEPAELVAIVASLAGRK